MVPSTCLLSFEGDARRQEARTVPRCLQPLRGWLTFWGPVPVAARCLPPAILWHPCFGVLAAGWCNSGGFSRAWDDVVERQRRFTTPPAACVATLILTATFTPPDSRTARVISLCLRSGCLKPHSRERQPFQKSHCDWRILVVSPVVLPRTQRTGRSICIFRRSTPLTGSLNTTLHLKICCRPVWPHRTVLPVFPDR